MFFFHLGKLIMDIVETDNALEQAVAFAKNIKSCGRCKILNSAVDVVRNVKLKDNYQAESSSVSGNAPDLSAVQAELRELKAQLQKMNKSPTRKSATQELATNIAMQMFKANFTKPGQIELALIFDDDSFIAGDIGRYRNKEELREYAKMQRNTIKALRGEPIDDEDEEESVKVVKKGHGKRTRVKVV
jgi:hypothetical protein